MLSDLGHGVADIGVRVEQVVVLVRFPVREGWQLLGNSLEKTNNNPDRRSLHIVAELVHGSRVLLRVSHAIYRDNSTVTKLTGTR